MSENNESGVRWVLVCALRDTQCFTGIERKKRTCAIESSLLPWRMSTREAKNIESDTCIPCKLQFILFFLWGYLSFSLPGKLPSTCEQGRSMFRHRKTSCTPVKGNSMW